MDICQCDVSHAGGISEMRKIASLAELVCTVWCTSLTDGQYDIGMAPHCPNGPLSFAATLQLGFVCPNFLISEMSWQVRYSITFRIDRVFSTN